MSRISGWMPSEKALLKKLSTPRKIQDFIDSLTYRSESIYCSPRQVLRDRKAHCFDGALFASACLRNLGHKPLIMDLRATNDDDHVIALFKERSGWGAVAKSNYSGLRFREPIYRNTRELAVSYFEDYFNLKGEKTLREYSGPFNLGRFDRFNWMTEDTKLEELVEMLDASRHFALLPKSYVPYKVDSRTFKAGTVGTKKSGIYRP